MRTRFGTLEALRDFAHALGWEAEVQQEDDVVHTDASGGSESEAGEIYVEVVCPHCSNRQRSVQGVQVADEKHSFSDISHVTRHNPISPDDGILTAALRAVVEVNRGIERMREVNPSGLRRICAALVVVLREHGLGEAADALESDARPAGESKFFDNGGDRG